MNLDNITMTPEQETRLRELATFFRTGTMPPSSTQELEVFPQFSMMIWKGNEVGEGSKAHPIDSLSHCGTICCIGGYYETFWGEDAANCANIGLPWQLRENLFYPDRHTTIDNPWFDAHDTWGATPEQAADAIDRALAMAPKADQTPEPELADWEPVDAE